MDANTQNGELSSALLVLCLSRATQGRGAGPASFSAASAFWQKGQELLEKTTMSSTSGAACGSRSKIGGGEATVEKNPS